MCPRYVVGITAVLPISVKWFLEKGILKLVWGANHKLSGTTGRHGLRSVPARTPTIINIFINSLF